VAAKDFDESDCWPDPLLGDQSPPLDLSFGAEDSAALSPLDLSGADADADGFNDGASRTLFTDGEPDDFPDPFSGWPDGLGSTPPLPLGDGLSLDPDVPVGRGPSGSGGDPTVDTPDVCGPDRFPGGPF
jgi:hypothetical protein